MITYQIEIVEPKAQKLLKQLADLNLIRVKKMKEPKQELKELLGNLRLKNQQPLDFDDIQAEVEAVRNQRYGKKQNSFNKKIGVG